MRAEYNLPPAFVLRYLTHPVTWCLASYKYTAEKRMVRPPQGSAELPCFVPLLSVALPTAGDAPAEGDGCAGWRIPRLAPTRHARSRASACPRVPAPGTPPRCRGFRQAWLVFGGGRRAGEIRAFLRLSGLLQAAVAGSMAVELLSPSKVDRGQPHQPVQKPSSGGGGGVSCGPASGRWVVSPSLPHKLVSDEAERHQDHFWIARRLGGNFNKLLQYSKIWVKPRNDAAEVTVGQPRKTVTSPLPSFERPCCDQSNPPFCSHHLSGFIILMFSGPPSPTAVN